MWSASSNRTLDYAETSVRDELTSVLDNGAGEAFYWDLNGNYAGNGVNAATIHK